MTAVAHMSVALFDAPALTRELRSYLDYLLDLPLPLPQEPLWDPGADAAAERLRNGMGPASRAMVELWLATLATMVANGPTDQRIVDAQCAAICFLCRDLPAAVWSEQSMIAYCDQSSFWPKPADLRQFMRARAERIEREIARLDAIAKAPSTRPGPVCGSDDYLNGMLADIAAGRTTGAPLEKEPREPIHAEGPEIIDKIRSVEEQLAALGFA